MVVRAWVIHIIDKINNHKYSQHKFVCIYMFRPAQAIRRFEEPYKKTQQFMYKN